MNMDLVDAPSRWPILDLSLFPDWSQPFDTFRFPSAPLRASRFDDENGFGSTVSAGDFKSKAEGIVVSPGHATSCSVKKTL